MNMKILINIKTETCYLQPTAVMKMDAMDSGQWEWETSSLTCTFEAITILFHANFKGRFTLDEIAEVPGDEDFNFKGSMK